MCIQYANTYTQCQHKINGQKIRCENFLSEPRIRCQKESSPQIINDLCPKCGGDSSQEPTITWIDIESIQSWSGEIAITTDETSNLETGIELLRKGSHWAMGGMERLMRIVWSNRSSDVNASQLEPVSSETESPSGDKSAALYTRSSKSLGESQTANKPFRAMHFPRIIEESSAHILANTTKNTNTRVLRTGLDVETATVVTTWSKVVSQAVVDRDRKVEELARADRRLARVRDERGYINLNLI